jgi:hypothetical protein
VGINGKGRHKERISEGEYGGCILYPYENRTMKPIEIVLRRGVRGRMMQRVNQIRIYYKYIYINITMYSLVM